MKNGPFFIDVLPLKNDTCYYVFYRYVEIPEGNPPGKKKQTWSRPAIPAVSMAIEWKNIFGQTHIYMYNIYITIIIFIKNIYIYLYIEFYIIVFGLILWTCGLTLCWWTYEKTIFLVNVVEMSTISRLWNGCR
jgi:hypothetical protein